MNLKKMGSIISIMLILAAIVIKVMAVDSMVPIESVIIMLFFLVVLIFEVLPVILTCILVLGLMPVLGVTQDFNTALTGFSNQVVFFILASFGIAAALMKVPISKRILRKMMLKYGADSKMFVLVFMICTALLSSVISNVPACAVFIAISMEFLNLLNEEDRKKTGKTLMIGIPLASMIGGVATPAGSSINLLGISLLEKYAAKTITFVRWMSMGIPIALVILPIAWILLIKVFPPANIEKGKIEKFASSIEIPSKLLPEEIRTIVIFSTVFILWLASSWIPAINIMVVSLLGCGVFCLPKVGVIKVEEFVKGVSWEAIFLVGTVLSLSAALVNNKVNDIMVSMLPDLHLNPFMILIYVTAMSFIMLIFIPVAPSLVAFLAPVVIHIAVSSGVDPALAVMLCAMCAGNGYLLPLDTVCLLSFSKGYYKMFEMTKVTYKLQLLFIFIVSAIVYFAGKI